MDHEQKTRDELFELIEAACENRLAESQHARLEEILRQHSWARGLYLECMHVQGLLERFDEARDDAGDDAPSPAEAAVSDSGGFVVRTELKREILRRPRSVSLTTATLVVTALLVLSAMIAAPIYWRTWQPATPEEQLATRQAEAWLSATFDAQWQEPDGRPEGKSLPSGTKLHLVSGRAEVTFRSGAKSVLSGPTEIEIEGASGLRLQRGKVATHVPSTAVGFFVRTKSAVVVDLGTEFGVSVNERDESYVEVFTGRVRLDTTTQLAADQPTQGVILSAGQGARIAGPGKAITPIDPQREAVEIFAKQMPEQLRVVSDAADGHFARVPGMVDFQTSISGPGKASQVRIGSGGEGGGKKRIVAAYFFPLPTLTGGRKLLSAELRSHFIESLTSPKFSVDVYALPGRDEATLLNEEFYLGPNDTRYPKIMGDILTAQSTPGPLRIRNQQLAMYLASLYEPDGTPRFKYAAFRFNPTSDPGNGAQGYALSMNENTEPHITQPHLVLHVEPETKPSPNSNPPGAAK